MSCAGAHRRNAGGRRDRHLSDLPITKVAVQQPNRLLGSNIAANHDDRLVRSVILAVKIDHVVAADPFDRLDVAGGWQAVRVIAVDHLIEAAIGDAARALFAFLQTNEPLTAYAFDMLGGKGGPAQYIGQNLNDQRKILDKAFAAEAGHV